MSKTPIKTGCLIAFAIALLIGIFIGSKLYNDFKNDPEYKAWIFSDQSSDVLGKPKQITVKEVEHCFRTSAAYWLGKPELSFGGPEKEIDKFEVLNIEPMHIINTGCPFRTFAKVRVTFIDMNAEYVKIYKLDIRYCRGAWDLRFATLINEGMDESQIIQNNQIPKNGLETSDKIPEVSCEFVYISPGSFIMGSGERDSIQHEVELTRGFYMQTTEFTQSQYIAATGNNASRFKGFNRPIERITWIEAIQCCNKLSQIEGLEPCYRLINGETVEWDQSANGFRLPTEAEWEYACRAGTTGAYSFIESGNDSAKYCNFCDQQCPEDWHDEINDDGYRYTAPVKSLEPNPWGLYDMHGNVYEWCWDFYGDFPKEKGVDPIGDSSGKFRVRKGGSWYEYLSNCRSGSRSYIWEKEKNGKDNATGFRPVRSVFLSPEIDSTGSPSRIVEYKFLSRTEIDSGLYWRVPELGLELVWADAGSFEMGSNSQYAQNDENPIHTVHISHGYWIGRFEVTQREYETIMGQNPSKFKGSERPVEQVSWNDAITFCEKLTQIEASKGRLPLGYRYRLPTEAEWEYAARGGQQSRNYVLSGSNKTRDVAWCCGARETISVGSLEPNELGLYDMSGNVFEWCMDWWGYYYNKDVTDPIGLPSSIFGRVVRGGSWILHSDYCRSTSRSHDIPTTKSEGTGFRIVCAKSDIFPTPTATPKPEIRVCIPPQITPKPRQNTVSAPSGFVYIEPGVFCMGSPDSETGRTESEKLHEETIEQGFFMQTTELTQMQYQTVLLFNPSKVKGRDLPVTNVDWFSALDVCNRLSKEDGLTPCYSVVGNEYTWHRKANGYRLPTEAEWEYACRAGTQTSFSFGDNVKELHKYCNFCDQECEKSISKSESTDRLSLIVSVKALKPNRWGLYGMHGNVYEWCWDSFHDYDEILHPQGKQTGFFLVDNFLIPRIIRGGSWASPGLNCRSASRFALKPKQYVNDVGFRVVRNYSSAHLESSFIGLQEPEQRQDWKIPGYELVMKYVQAGEFIMGQSEKEKGLLIKTEGLEALSKCDDELPRHSVSISKGFWIGKYEITKAEYEAVMENDIESISMGMSRIPQKVSWSDAMKFCELITKQEEKTGRLPTGYVYRLPTEAEWEYAAKEGVLNSDFLYSGSDNLDEVGWYGKEGDEYNPGNFYPIEVGTKRQNALGLNDMSGNAWEWCLDWYSGDYYEHSQKTDPRGPQSGSKRVQRGGFYIKASSLDKMSCRVSNRERNSPAFEHCGFRIVLAQALK